MGRHQDLVWHESPAIVKLNYAGNTGNKGTSNWKKAAYFYKLQNDNDSNGAISLTFEFDVC